MKRLFLGLATIGLTSVATGCAKDPTGTLSGTPSSIATSLSLVNVTFGDSILVTAELRDEQGVPLSDVPEVASATPAIVEVVAADEPPLSIRRFYVKGVGAGAGEVTVSFGSVSKTVTVIVFPTSFDGTLAVSTAGRLDVVTITATAAIGFDTTASTATINGDATHVVSVTPTELQVVALNAATAGEVAVQNLVFLPGTDNEATIDELPADATVDVSGEPDEPANNSDATATVLTLGTAVEGSISGTDADDWFQFTLAAPATVTVTTTFEGGGGDPDLDIFLFDATLTFCDIDGGCAMATGNNPESYTTASLAAGTYYVLVELFDSGDAATPHWYSLVVN